MKYFIITGRIEFDDEDCIRVCQAPNAYRAKQMFNKEIKRIIKDRDRIRTELGSPDDALNIYINTVTVVESELPPQVLEHP